MENNDHLGLLRSASALNSNNGNNASPMLAAKQAQVASKAQLKKALLSGDRTFMESQAQPEPDAIQGGVTKGDFAVGFLGTGAGLAADIPAMATGAGVGAVNLGASALSESINAAFDPNYKRPVAPQMKQPAYLDRAPAKGPYSQAVSPEEDAARRVKGVAERKEYMSGSQLSEPYVYEDVLGNALTKNVKGFIKDTQDKFYSANYKVLEENRIQELSSYESQLKDARVKAGEKNDTDAIGRDQGKVFYKTLESLADKPLLLAQKVTEMFPYMISAGLISKSISKAVLKKEMASINTTALKEASDLAATGSTAKRLEALLAKQEGKKLTRQERLNTSAVKKTVKKDKAKVSEISANLVNAESKAIAKSEAAKVPAAIAATGVMEGSSNASDYKTRVLNTSFKDLRANSEKFNEYEKKYSAEKSRNLVAQEGGLVVGIGSGLAAAGVSAITGGAKLEANLFQGIQKETIKGAAATTSKAAGRELLEEGGQSSSGTVISNAQAKADIDSNQEITKGLGRSTAEGALLGALSAGSTQGIKSAGNLTKETAKVVSGKANEFKGRFQEAKARDAEREAAEAATEEAPKAAPLKKEYAEEHKANKEFVAEVKKEQAAAPVKNEKVTELLGGLDQLQQGIDEMLNDDPDKGDLATRMLRTASLRKNTDTLPEHINTLLDSDLSDADRKVVEGIRDRYTNAGSDTFIGAMAHTVSASPALTKQMDAALNTLLASQDPNASDAVIDATEDSFISSLQEDTESAEQLMDTLIRVKLFSTSDISKDAAYTAEGLDTLSEMVQDEDLSYELSQAAEVKRGVIAVNAEFMNGSFAEDATKSRSNLQKTFKNLMTAIENNEESRIKHNLKELTHLRDIRTFKVEAMREGIANHVPGAKKRVSYKTAASGKTSSSVEINDRTETSLLPFVESELAAAENALTRAEKLVANQSEPAPTEATVESPESIKSKQAIFTKLRAVKRSQIPNLPLGSKIGALLQEASDQGLSLTYSDIRSVSPASWGKRTVISKVEALNQKLAKPVQLDLTNNTSWTKVKSPAGNTVQEQFRGEIQSIEDTFPSTGQTRTSSSFRENWGNAVSLTTKIIGAVKPQVLTTQSGKEYTAEASRITNIGVNTEIINTGKYTSEDKVLIAYKVGMSAEEQSSVTAEVKLAVKANATIMFPLGITGSGKGSNTYSSPAYDKTMKYLKREGYSDLIQNGADTWVSSVKSEPAPEPKKETKPKAAKQPAPESMDKDFSKKGLLSKTKLSSYQIAIKNVAKAKATIATLTKGEKDTGLIQANKIKLKNYKKNLPAYEAKVSKMLEGLTDLQLKQVKASPLPFEVKYTPLSKKVKQGSLDFEAEPEVVTEEETEVTPEPEVKGKGEQFPTFMEWMADNGLEAEGKFNALPKEEQEIISELYPEDSIEFLKKKGIHLSPEGTALHTQYNKMKQELREAKKQTQAIEAEVQREIEEDINTDESLNSKAKSAARTAAVEAGKVKKRKIGYKKLKEAFDKVKATFDKTKALTKSLVQTYGTLYIQAKDHFKQMRALKVDTPQEYVQNIITLINNPEVLSGLLSKEQLATPEATETYLQALSDEEIAALYQGILKAVDASQDVLLKRKLASKMSVPVQLNSKAASTKEVLTSNPFTNALQTVKNSPLWGNRFNNSLVNNPDKASAYLEEVLGLPNNPINRENLEGLFTHRAQFEALLNEMTHGDSKNKRLNDVGFANSPIQQLLDEQGNFPEPIVEVLFVSYLRTLGNVGTSEGIPNWELARMLRITEVELASLEGAGKFQKLGTMMTMEDFTRTFKSTLGMQVSADVTSSIMDNLHGNIGAMLFELAQTESDFNKQLEVRHETINNKKYTGFIMKAKLNNEPTFLAKLQEGEDLLGALAATDDLTSRNFLGRKPDDVDTTYNNIRGKGNYTDEAVRAENNSRTIAWEFNTDMAEYYYEMGETNFLTAHGYLQTEEINKLNVNLREHYNGKNIQLIGSYRKFVEHYERTLSAIKVEAVKADIENREPDPTVGHTYFASQNSSVRRAQMRGSFNPQADKFHRALFQTVNTGEVPTATWFKADTDFNSSKIGSQEAFTLGLGQALGMDADKQPNQKTYTATLDLINRALETYMATLDLIDSGSPTDINLSEVEGDHKYNDVIQAAIKLATGSAKDKAEALALTTENSTDLEAFHQKQGIFALAQLLKATSPETAETAAFKHSLRFEIDGVTNGPHHNNVALALGEERDYFNMQAGGILEGHETKGIHHKSEKDKDNYQYTGEVANSVKTELRELYEDLVYDGVLGEMAQIHHDNMATANTYLNQISITVGGNFVKFSKAADLEGNLNYSMLRNLFKNPVTVTVYGGGKEGIINNLRAGITDAFYTSLTEYAQALEAGTIPKNMEAELLGWAHVFSQAPFYKGENDTDATTIAKMFPADGSRDLMKRELNGQSDMDERAKLFRNFTLSDEHLKRMSSVITDKFSGVATITTEAIDKVYKHNKNTAALMNAGTNFITLLANDLYKEMYTKLQTKRVEAGTLKKGEALSRADFAIVEKQLKKALPGVKTALVDDTGDIRKQTAENKSAAGTTAKTNLPITRTDDSKTNNITSDIDTTHKDFSPLGVAVIPRVIISIDGNMQIQNHILQGLLGDYLNVYDAIDKGADENLQAAAEVANIADYIATMEADPVQAVSDLFGKSLEALNQGVILDGDIVINPVMRKMKVNDESNLTPNYNQYRIAINGQEMPLQEYLPSLTQITDVGTLTGFLAEQLQTMAYNTRAFKEDLWFKGDMTNSQMGGVDNGVARIHEGQVVISENTRAYLSEEAIAHIEAFNKRMEERYLPYSKETVSVEQRLKESNPIWDEIREATKLGLKGKDKEEVKSDIAAQFSATGDLFIEALYQSGTPTDFTNMVFTFKTKADQKALIELFSSRGIQLDPRQKAYLLNNSSNLHALLSNTTVKIVEKDSSDLQGEYGAYDAQKETIYLRAGMNINQASTVLAHELSHMFVDSEITENSNLMGEGKMDEVSVTFKQQAKLLYKLVTEVKKNEDDPDVANMLENNVALKTIVALYNEMKRKEKILNKDNPSSVAAYQGSIRSVMQEHLAYSLTDTKLGSFTRNNPEYVVVTESFFTQFNNMIDALKSKVAALYLKLIPKGSKNISNYGKTITIKADYLSNLNMLNKEVFINYVGESTTTKVLKNNKAESNLDNLFSRAGTIDADGYLRVSNVLDEALIKADFAGASPKHQDSLLRSVSNIRSNIFTGNVNDTPTTPYVTNVHSAYLAAGIPLAGSSLLVYEQLAQIMAAGSKHHWFSAAALYKVFTEAKKQLTVEDLLPEGVTTEDADYNAHMTVAETRYEAIFNDTSTQYLTNFAALTESSEWFSGIMGKVRSVNQTTEEVDSNLLTRAHKGVHSAMLTTGERIAKIPKEGSAREKVKALNINMLRATKHTQREKGVMGKSEDSLDGFLKLLTKSGVQALTKLMYQVPSLSAPAQAVERLLLDPEGQEGRASELRKKLIQTVLSEFLIKDNQKMGMVREFLAEFFPRETPASLRLDRLKDSGSYRIDSVREDQEVTTHTLLKEKFSKVLSKEENKTVGLALRADLNVLLKNISLNSVQELLENEAELDKEISNSINSLMRNKKVSKSAITLAVNEATSLGYRSITGGVYAGLNLPNAYVIGLQTNTLSSVEALDTLASLNSLKALSQKEKEGLSNLIKEEGKGIEYALKIHKGVQNKLLERDGEIAKVALPKGHLNTQNETNTNLRVVTLAQSRVLRGYTKVRTLVPDAYDTNKETLVLMKSTEGGSLRWVEGAMSIIEKVVGNTVIGDLSPKNKGITWYGNSKNTKAINYRKRRNAEGTRAQTVLAPKMLKDGMVPILNASGTTVGYQYALSNEEQATQGETDFSALLPLAKYSARVQEETIASNHNVQVVAALKAAYDDRSSDKQFIRIDGKSKDKQLAEIWRVAPLATKEAFHTAFGENAIYVNRVDLNNALGFREQSIVNLWDYPKNSKVRRNLTYLLEAFDPNAMQHLRTMERLEQDVVMTAKDIITVRSAVVPMGNLVSNINQVYMSGIPHEYIFKEGLNAVNGVRAYKRDLQKYLILQTEASIEENPKRKGQLQKDMSQLNKHLRNNPVFTTVKEGLLPTVIDELSKPDEKKSLKDQLIEKALPDVLKGESQLVDIGKEFLITEDSATHKMLSEMLELGDFAGKFILYRWLTEQEGMDSETALEQVRVEFINYGTLTGKTQDYLNKVGGLFFFKYFQRGQAIQIRRIAKRPTRALVSMLGLSTIIPTVFDASIVSKDLTNTTGVIDLIKMAEDAHLML